MDFALLIENLWFKRSDSFTLHVGELALKRGQAAAVTGPSGCGKSTLLECVALLHESMEARSLFIGDCDALSLKGTEKDEIRRTALGFMPQVNGLLPFLSVSDNIKMQIDLSHRNRDKKYKKVLFDNAMSILDSLGVGSLSSKKPHEMSVGQRQRASFVRAIAHEPLVVLIDEPTSALDPNNASALFGLIKSTVALSKSCALVVTHDYKGVSEYNYNIYACSSRAFGDNVCSFGFKGGCNV